MSRPSLWAETDARLPRFTELRDDLDVDVLVVGGGIAGMTAALLLAREGRSVALIEARTLGAGETARTTAHLTAMLDTRYQTLESKFGVDVARGALQSHQASIARIEAFASEFAPDCAFRRVPGYLVAKNAEQRTELERELVTLQRLGAKPQWMQAVPLPLPCAGALRLDDQAEFRPLEYLKALAVAFVASGGLIFEGTRLLELEKGDRCRALTAKGVISARHVLIATHAPAISKVALHTKLAAYRTYAVAHGTLDQLPDGLFWTMDDPYHYVRSQRIGALNYLIVGGEDHKTGHTDDGVGILQKLSDFAHSLYSKSSLAYSWSGQILETSDGLPLIGTHPGSSNVYVATGFAGNGMTFGTLSGMLLSDAVHGRDNPWAQLFEPRRLKPFASARYFSENVDFPARLARDRLNRGEVSDASAVPRGEGRLLRSKGKMLAVYRDHAGALHSRSAACTHLGCYVRWNACENTWDCPCHGSRFDTGGEVLNGPATRALEEGAPGPERSERSRPSHPSAPRPG
jgi:glycine/D-amino acid oxidase-like deaminating enzyme/nitrite reductase/ring-hydroxylating ferredoxin subunit